MAGVTLISGSSANPYVNNTSIDGAAGDRETGAARQLINYASISGNIGVYLAQGGALTQGSAGYIVGTTVGVEISNGAGTVSNAGTIKGGAGNIGGSSHCSYGGAGGAGIVLSQASAVERSDLGSPAAAPGFSP
jgi:hypothetical protein